MDAGQCQGQKLRSSHDTGRTPGRRGEFGHRTQLQPSEEGGITSACQEGWDFLAGFSKDASDTLIPHPTPHNLTARVIPSILQTRDGGDHMGPALGLPPSVSLLLGVQSLSPTPGFGDQIASLAKGVQTPVGRGQGSSEWGFLLPPGGFQLPAARRWEALLSPLSKPLCWV